MNQAKTYRLAPNNRCAESRRQSGIALITVLLIVSLMVSLLGFLVEQQHLLIRRMSNQNVSEQGHQYAAGVDAWASRLLHDDSDRAVDYWDEDWARFGDPLELDDDAQQSFSLDLSSQQEKSALPSIDFGFNGLEYQIEDLQGRYNLNNLANREPAFAADQKTLFLNLLGLLEVGEFDIREQLYAALVDWLDENDLKQPAGGAENQDYQIKSTPYYAADQKLTSLGELRFVEGFSEQVINTIRPYVAVLPVENARININTTSTEVLSSLGTAGVADTSSVDTFLAQRLDEAFVGFNEQTAAQNAIINLTPAGGGFIRNMLQTNSYFFRITSRVTLGETVYCTQTTVLRESGNPDDSSAPKVAILNREHNTLCDEIVH